MKLIDLLVQELPKRGGWPEGADYCWQDWDKEIRFDGGESNFYACLLCENHRPNRSKNPDKKSYYSANREQYEAAFAAPVWNGKGLPPVGCECEYSLNAGATYYPCKIEYMVGTQGVVMSCDVSEGVQYVNFDTYGSDIFRMVRTESERKREERITTLNNFISGFMKSTDGNYTHLGEAIYEWQNVLDKVKK